MKVLVLLMVLVSSGTTLAQRKKQETATDSTASTVAVAGTTKAEADALKSSQKFDSLTHKFDSLEAELVLYQGFYAYISNKFFPEKFKKIEIEKAIPLADSLSTANNSKAQGLQMLSKSKIDSLSFLLKTADTLRIENQTFRTLLISLLGSAVFPLNEAELKGTWQVFVQPAKVTGTGQESAIISMDKMIIPDSLFKYSIKQIVFLEEDLADVYFVGGKKTKCFYKVTGFSREKTYFIHLQKADEINIKMFVTPVPRGLQVSYKAGKEVGQYMFGYMRK